MPTPRPITSRVRETLTIWGTGLVLLALLLGLAIPLFPSPRLALSAHLAGLMSGTMLIGFGLMWRRITLSKFTHHFACWLCIFGCYGVFAGNILSALKNTRMLTPIAQAESGNTTLAAQSVEFQVAAVLGVASFLLILGVLAVFIGLIKNRSEAIRNSA